MKKLALLAIIPLVLVNDGGCDGAQKDPAAARQSQATQSAMNAADREIGMPRMVNYAQRKLLKNAYEDMDQTTLTYVYSQGIDGRFVCLGQALGYGVSLGTEFTAPHVPEYHSDGAGGSLLLDQADPNMLYMPTSGAATIVDLINPANGEAHTAVVEPNVVTVPFKLPASTVTVPCPGDVDPSTVKDVKETSVASQLK